MVGLAPSPIGVDVEALPSPESVSRLVRALHPQEGPELEALVGPEQWRAFAQLWVRKEAYLKGLGTGLGRDLAADYLGTSQPRLRPPGWEVANVGAPEGYAAAYAVQGRAAQVVVKALPSS